MINAVVDDDMSVLSLKYAGVLWKLACNGYLKSVADEE